MRDKISAECSVIQENCTYNAEMHHSIAARHLCYAFFLQLLPAIFSAVSGGFALSNGAALALWLSVGAGVLTAMLSIINPVSSYYNHLAAAKIFVALKHEARTLRDLYGVNLSDQEYLERAHLLDEKYATIVQFVPPTTIWALERARRTIKDQHIHDPDIK